VKRLNQQPASPPRLLNFAKQKTPQRILLRRFQFFRFEMPGSGDVKDFDTLICQFVIDKQVSDAARTMIVAIV
jgi:hypothetical protein